jgi:predicted lipoprotein with Yx(FWY)xxD motif
MVRAVNRTVGHDVTVRERRRPVPHEETVMTTDIRTAADRPTVTCSGPARRPRVHSTTRRAAAVALVATLALAGAACSSSKKSTSSTTTSGAYGSTSTTSVSSSTTSGGSGAASATVATTSLGSVMVDAKGFTLYFYKKDTAETSTCEGGCATAWPPAIVSGPPVAGDGVTGTLTTTARPDGSTQLVFGPATAGKGLGGHPLYRYSGDTKPGDVNGQGIGGVWSAAGPDGQPMT